MDNKQKRKLLILIYRTIFLFAFIALATTVYICIDKLFFNKEQSVMWFDIVILCYVFFNICIIMADITSTRKLTNKYKLAKFIFFVFITSFIGLLVLGICIYFNNIDFISYLSYLLPICLVFATELILVLNFILSLSLTKLHKSTTVTIDANSETPTFDDEVILKKRLDELNRKLEMKKVQEQIENIEKQLDE